MSGEGKVTATPDLLRIRAGVSELADTTKAAQEAMNIKMNQILSTLEKHGVKERDIQTRDLSFSPEYEWKEDSGRELVGQRVRQTVIVEIEDIDETPERVTSILDSLGTVNGLELNSVEFDIEDKTELFSQAREKAFEKAHQKAEELAKAGGVKLKKPIMISENTINYTPIYARNMAVMEMDAAGMGGGSALPSGELDVTANVSVVYGIE